MRLNKDDDKLILGRQTGACASRTDAVLCPDTVNCPK